MKSYRQAIYAILSSSQRKRTLYKPLEQRKTLKLKIPFFRKTIEYIRHNTMKVLRPLVALQARKKKKYIVGITLNNFGSFIGFVPDIRQ